MKKNVFKKLFNLSWLFLAALLTFTACSDDDDDDDNGIIVLDGIYIKGDATALTDFDADGRFAVTKNEVLQEERSTLYEKYIAIKGTGGFSIVQVAGNLQTTYGPGTDFGVVGEDERDVEEPQVDFWRGSITESETQFEVPADGFYHVVIDTEVGKVAIMPVTWGVIGAATPNGWGGSTAMTPSAFDLETMTYSLTDMELRGGDWKFRYSDGWKVILDTVIDLGEGNKGVKVNTNFGGTISDLEPGGDNMVNENPGIYDISLTWTLGSGHSATATKTGDLPLTNWTGVICDAVGTGVSADNPDAIPDPSGWGWGNKLLADGEPTVDGDVYTWTWTGIILEADEGFKLRTENGEAPASGNGANFDAGLEAVDHENSSANVSQETSGDLLVTVKATYNITLVIDAADNDSKVITITEAK
ncbi:MAG: hypothetical protein R6V23_08775 [Bacteroidales bacterium]